MVKGLIQYNKKFFYAKQKLNDNSSKQDGNIPLTAYKKRV